MSIQVQSNCYLHYAFQEASNGLRCSMDQTNTQTESIELGISNTRGVNVYVRKITLTFPLGSDQANHLAGSSNITFNYSPNDQFTVVQQSPGVFVITPIQSGTTVTWLNQGLYLRFTGIVMNTTLGVCKIKVDEISSLNTPNSTSDQVGWYWFGKYPYEFYMRNFVADNSTVAPNSSVTLSWTGAANGNYKMKWYDANGMQSADVTATRSWQSPPLLQSTVFELYGVSTSGPQRAISLAATVLVAESSVGAPPVTTAGAITGDSLTISGGVVQLNSGNGGNVMAFDNRNPSENPISSKDGAVRQKFKAAAAGPVAWIDVYVLSAASQLKVSLQEVTGDKSASGPMAGATLVPTAASWNRVTFPKVANLVAGTTYVVQIDNTSSGNSFELGGTNHQIEGASCNNGKHHHHNVCMAVALTTTSATGMTVTTDGLVGIGNPNPAYLLDVGGSIRATQLHESSDISLKRNITTLPDVMSQLLQLRGVQYERRDSGMREIGLISQEVEGVFPELVQQDAQGLGSVAYARLTAVLVEAVKSLNAEVEALRAEIKDLRKG